MRTRSALALAAVAAILAGTAAAQDATPGQEHEPKLQKPASTQTAAQPDSMKPAAPAKSKPAGSTAAATPRVAEAEPAPSPSRDFALLDANKDGTLTAEETRAKPALHDTFETFDRNRDGVLSAAEYGEWQDQDPEGATPADPSTAPSGSSGAQHMRRQ